MMDYRFKDHRSLTLLFVVILLFGCFLRLLFLSADPPPDVSISGGILGDPGQYSYGARNLLLFDRTAFDQWDPHTVSPLMSYLNYLIYRLFGINYVSHRLIPLLFSIGTLFLVAYISYRFFGLWVALFSGVFLSFNYPLIIFSKSANRQFPMYFFFLLALLFFVLAAERKRNWPAALGALFFFLSYLSKGSILPLVSLFLVLSIYWLWRKKISIRPVLSFFIPLTLLFMSWWWLVYLPNRAFINAFIDHNKLVRNISSLGHLFQNILNSPFLVQFRSEPVLLLLSLASIVLIFYRVFSRTRPVPKWLEVAVFWMLIGLAMNGISSYRPIRFYLDLIIPASLLAGWLLARILDGDREFKPGAPLLIALICGSGLLIFYGILKYMDAFARIINRQSLFPYMFLVVILLFVLLLKFRSFWIRCAFVLCLLFFSLFSNLNYFKEWTSTRDYQLVNISRVFARAIPPARVAGNWASILSTGTPHQTILAWPNMVNWEADFLSRNKIEYLFLSDFAAEHRNYRSMFAAEMSNASLLARFPLYGSWVYLYDLNSSPERGKFEAEACRRSAGRVEYAPEWSGRMALRLLAARSHDPIRVELPLEISHSGLNQLTLRGRGRFIAELELKREEETVWRKSILFNRSGTGSKTVRTKPVPAGSFVLHMSIRVEGQDAWFDSFSFDRMPSGGKDE